MAQSGHSQLLSLFAIRHCFIARPIQWKLPFFDNILDSLEMFLKKEDADFLKSFKKVRQEIE